MPLWDKEREMTHDAKASDMNGTSVVHKIKRFNKSGKSKVELAMNDVKEGRASKPKLGMDAAPTKTRTMSRDFGRTHA